MAFRSGMTQRLNISSHDFIGGDNLEPTDAGLLRAFVAHVCQETRDPRNAEAKPVVPELLDHAGIAGFLDLSHPTQAVVDVLVVLAIIGEVAELVVRGGQAH